MGNCKFKELSFVLNLNSVHPAVKMGSFEGPGKFNVIIVGAGIAGFAAAIGLHQKGHKVTILERHPNTQALGGPINLSPSATRILTDYGLRDDFYKQLDLEDQPRYFRRFADGRELGYSPPGVAQKLYGTA